VLSEPIELSNELSVCFGLPFLIQKYLSPKKSILKT